MKRTISWNRCHFMALIDKNKSNQFPVSHLKLTVDSEPGLGGIRWSKVVGNDTLVLSLAGKLHITELQGGRILCHLGLTSCARLHTQMGLVVDLGIVQDLVVFLPSEGHGRVAGAGGRADKRHIGALEGWLGLWLHCDLRLWEVIWENNKRANWELIFNSCSCPKYLGMFGHCFTCCWKTKENKKSITIPSEICKVVQISPILRLISLSKNWGGKYWTIWVTL